MSEYDQTEEQSAIEKPLYTSPKLVIIDVNGTKGDSGADTTVVTHPNDSGS